jgi:hypothetical protein
MNETRRPAWREPMLWMAAALPLAVLVAAGVTIAIASGSAPDRGEPGVRRIAQVQLADLGPDRAAARAGLRGRLEADASHGRLMVRIDDVLDDRLELSLVHPIDGSEDRRVVLQRDGEAFRGETAPWSATQSWTLRVQPRDGAWRLGGRLHPKASRADLQPAVPR